MSATLFDVPSAPVADETAALLDLIAGDPIHERDRRVIVRAIVAEAHASAGRIDPNRLRARLADPAGGPTVYPRVIGAVVQALAQRRVLVADGWVVSTDRRGGNAGRPARIWKLVREL